jgi:hypothetical protein
VRLLHMLNSRDQLTKPHSEFQSRTQTFRADDWLEPLGRGVVPGQVSTTMSFHST